ncbi:Os12g0144700 [Oryza sativa Japonica Group]|uniref:Os12g0144700 protein n=1 Tax=Oryza sativa subsp. japonica TaxID=39947 RepID=A0A0P0Y7H3_ORYSJ|nr:hypothetical protein EE612_057750 [Oryza sativa]BAT15872.1 Os12g0144700 [Oryza sativa Japonica Group]
MRRATAAARGLDLASAGLGRPAVAILLFCCRACRRSSPLHIDRQAHRSPPLRTIKLVFLLFAPPSSSARLLDLH